MQDVNLNTLGQKLSRFVVGCEGNISRKISNGFLIKSSGKSFKDNDFIKCNISGQPLANQRGKPSSEVSFHALIYRNSNFNFIAHTHPVNTLKILCTEHIYEFASQRLFPDQIVFNDGRSIIVPYATPGKDLTEQIKRSTSELKTFPSLLLLQNHGIIACGNSSKEVLITTEICEKSAEIFIGAKLLGNPCFLNYGQILAIKNHKDEIYRKSLL